MNNRNDQQLHVNRRRFVQSALAGAAGAMHAPAILRGRNLNERLNIAAIGVGGRGRSNLSNVSSQNNIVALCDVNQRNLNAAAANHAEARTFVDFRKMYDQANQFTPLREIAQNGLEIDAHS